MTGKPIDLYEFVFDSLIYLQTAQLQSGDTGQHPDQLERGARAWCLAARDFAVVQFGRTGARDAFERWGLWRSEDIGRVVTGLVAAKVIEPEETDRIPGVFDGLFTLDELFPRA